jgi:decaprenylphospho-beta-D-erythro-pentofuranosid-2-ulose 2-reductase
MIDGNGYPQNILVVGGSSEIAAAIVEKLSVGPLERVALLGPREATVAPVAESLNQKKIEAKYFPLDLLELNSCAHGLAEPVNWLGTVDLVLMASGILADPKQALDPDYIAQVMTLNLAGPCSILGALAKILKEQGHGQIVVLSSVAGEFIRKSNFLYGASKAGLDGFTLGLAANLEPDIQVLVVRPGFVRTKMTAHLPTPPLSATPERVAKDVVAALAGKKLVVWSPPLMRPIMAIIRHLPRKLAWKLPF